jgi:hypothetical protein
MQGTPSSEITIPADSLAQQQPQQPKRPCAPKRQPRRIQQREGGEAHGGDKPPLSADTFVADPTVAKEFGVSLMSLWRWSQDKHLNFPAAIKIRNRNFRSRRALEAFKSRMMLKAIAEREAL